MRPVWKTAIPPPPPKTTNAPLRSPTAPSRIVGEKTKSKSKTKLETEKAPVVSAAVDQHDVDELDNPQAAGPLTIAA